MQQGSDELTTGTSSGAKRWLPRGSRIARHFIVCLTIGFLVHGCVPTATVCRGPHTPSAEIIRIDNDLTLIREAPDGDALGRVCFWYGDDRDGFVLNTRSHLYWRFQVDFYWGEPPDPTVVAALRVEMARFFARNNYGPREWKAVLQPDTSQTRVLWWGIIGSVLVLALEGLPFWYVLRWVGRQIASDVRTSPRRAALAHGRCPACCYEICLLPLPRCPECGGTWSAQELEDAQAGLCTG